MRLLGYFTSAVNNDYKKRLKKPTIRGSTINLKDSKKKMPSVDEMATDEMHRYTTQKRKTKSLFSRKKASYRTWAWLPSDQHDDAKY